MDFLRARCVLRCVTDVLLEIRAQVAAMAGVEDQWHGFD